jgi:SprT protein
MQLSLFQFKSPPPTPAHPSLEDKIRSVIGPRIPEAAIEYFIEQYRENPVGLKVVRHRTSKSGDYRPAQRGRPPRITVNGNLNPYAFLITLVHELAHHHVDIDHDQASRKFTIRRKSKPQPHGKEWKDQFRLLMQPYLDPWIFPPDILTAVVSYLGNPRASSTADHSLTRALKRYDPPDDTVPLESLPFDAIFSLHGKRRFRKKEKVRTRYRCICLQTNRIYLVNGNAPVEPIM